MVLLAMGFLKPEQPKFAENVFLDGDAATGASLVVRAMAGATNGRNALPGTIRGDYCMSNQQNIVHTSDSLENAKIELARFFKPEEIFEYESSNLGYLYALDEL